VARDDPQGLRIVVHDGDRSSLVQILSGGVHRDALQLVGDALVAAAAEGVAGAEELADARVDALRERGWAGDEELAAELDAALRRRPAPLGRSLPVDSEEFRSCSKPASARRSGPSTWRLARYGTP
jgi:hypothetical protein